MVNIAEKMKWIILLKCFIFSGCHHFDEENRDNTGPVSELNDFKNKYTALMWEESFAGNAIDTSIWRFENQNYWNFGEYQDFTNSIKNASVENGSLNITLQRETDGTKRKFTSASLSTRGKKSFRYGRYEIRAQVPFGKGIHSFIGLKTNNDSGTFVRECETIDIINHLGKNPNNIRSIVRFLDDKGHYLSRGVSFGYKSTEPLQREFHTYTLVWEKNQLVFFFEEIPYLKIIPEILLPHDFGFDEAAYLLMNISMGGRWAGEPDEVLNSYPQNFKIDYIRYYTNPELDTTKPEAYTLDLPGYDNYNALVWSDEFNGPEIDTTKWNHETGDYWYNNEIQSYTDDPVNSYVAHENLVLTAHKGKLKDKTIRDYTSARMTTIHKMALAEGRIDVRAKVPFGKGIWPAIWMLPVENTFGYWPSSGEIDILEVIGDEMNVVHSACHYGENGDHHGKGIDYIVPFDLSDDFHVYSLVKEKDKLWWYFDGTPIHYISKELVSPVFYPFNEEFYLILNIAVGGNWPGYPDSTTIFPQRMLVDYVRVFDKN